MELFFAAPPLSVPAGDGSDRGFAALALTTLRGIVNVLFW